MMLSKHGVDSDAREAGARHAGRSAYCGDTSSRVERGRKEDGKRT